MNHRILAIAAVAAAVAAAGCSSVECGSGTKEENGTCIPEALSVCGEGTKLDAGKCKPTGVARTCGPGTEDVNGQCVVADPMKRVTVPEAAEPNEAAEAAKRFDLPAVGAAPVVLGGIINVPEENKGDADTFIFNAQGTVRVKVRATAVGAPEISALLQPADDRAALRRYVVDFTRRDAERELVLPGGGEWIITVTEPANGGSGAKRGSDAFSYTLDVSRLEMPQAKPLLDGGKGEGTWNDGAVWAIPGTGVTSLMKLELAAPAEGESAFPGVRAAWATDNAGALVFAGADNLSSYGSVTPMEAQYIPVPADGALLGFDYVIAEGPVAVPYRFELVAASAQDVPGPLPATVTGSLEDDGVEIYVVDVPANYILRAKSRDVDYDATPRIELRDATFQLVASDTGWSDWDYGTSDADVTAFVPAGREGRWFIVVKDADFETYDSDLDFTVDIEGRPVEAMDPLTGPGTVSTQATLGAADEVAYYTVRADVSGLVQFSAVPGDAAMRLRLKLLKMDLSSIDSDYATQAGNAVGLSLNVNAPGATMLLAVSSDTPGTAQVSARLLAVEEGAEQEPNDGADSANALAVSETAVLRVAAQLSAPADKDFFRITLTGNATLQVETAEAQSAHRPDTEIVLYAADGSEIDTDDDGGEGLFSRIVQTGLAAGDYVVEVKYHREASAPATARDYHLLVSMQPTP